MIVCISASPRFKKEIKEVSGLLKKLGIKHFLPNMELPKELETPDMISRLVEEHFRKIDKSGGILIVNPGGYFGNSAKVEIGYAKGQDKKIYYMERTNLPELDCLADRIITREELYLLKEQ